MALPPALAAFEQLAVVSFDSSSLRLTSCTQAARALLGFDAVHSDDDRVSAELVLATGAPVQGAGDDRDADVRSKLHDLARRTSELQWGDSLVLEYWAHRGGCRTLERADVLVSLSASSSSSSPAPAHAAFSILFLRSASTATDASSFQSSADSRHDSRSPRSLFRSASDIPAPSTRTLDLPSPPLSARSLAASSSASTQHSVASDSTSSGSSSSTRRTKRVVTGDERAKIPLNADLTSMLQHATRGLRAHPAGSSYAPRSPSISSAYSTETDSSSVPAGAPVSPPWGVNDTQSHAHTPPASTSASADASAARARLPPPIRDLIDRRPSLDASILDLSARLERNAGTARPRMPDADDAHSGPPSSAGDDTPPSRPDMPASRVSGGSVASAASLAGSAGQHPAAANASEANARDVRLPLTLTQLTNIIEVMPQMAFIADNVGQVQWLNAAWFRYTGQDPSYNLSFAEWAAMFHPDDLQEVLPIYLGAVQAGTDFSFEYRVKGADGQLRWHVCQGRPWRNEAGEIESWYGNIMNVDDLIRNRHDALLIKERTKAVLEGSELTLLTIDPNYRITFFEGRIPPFTLKGDPPSIVGEYLEDLCANEDLKAAVRRIMEGEETVATLQTKTIDDKGTLHHRYRLVPLRGDPAIPSTHPDARAITGCILVGVDVTERVVAENALEKSRRESADLAAAELAAREANRLKTEFLTTISHEIRTPIAGILGICELLLADSGRLSEDQRTLVEKAVRSGEILLDLVGAVLDVRKVETGELTLEAAPFSLADALMDARLFSVIAQKKGLEFVEDFGETYEGTLLGDRLRLRQVLVNALGNSVKFTREGSVTLRCHQLFEDDSRVVIRFVVDDTGVGIGADVLPTLFRPFKQASAGTAREYGGSGLGLTIAKNLVELMGGTIGLTSQLGKGSRMTITIPFTKAPLSDVVDFVGTVRPLLPGDTAGASEVQQFERGVERERKTRRPEDVRILLAEDNELIREIVTRTLRKARFVVDAVEDGRRCIEQVQKEDYNVVLMDGQMPGMDGYEATKTLRASHDARIRNLRIIALTASAIAGDRERCIESGMNSYLAKPVRAKELEAAIWKQVELAEQRDATA
ncbi:uncharacterized protein JCM10292_005995 [Rhodotorula paludigena]|uniref:uncharacterized protein n=1 Tax=Rhodotorula paludigena TaxID=86838 RepID=UPI003173B4A7